MSSIPIKDGCIKLMWTGLPTWEMTGIIDAVTTQTSLTALDILYNRLTPEKGEQLATALAQNTSLTRLQLDGNLLTDVGAIKIAAAISSHPTLRSLHLDNCLITSEGIPSILTSISPITTLTFLSLRFNKFADEKGMDAVAQFLSTKTTIHTLNLSHMGKSCPGESPDQLSDEACAKIFEALKGNSTLTDLKLNGNLSLTDEIVPSIQEALSSSVCQLKDLDLTDCHISPTGIARIQDVINSISRQTTIHLHTPTFEKP